MFSYGGILELRGSRHRLLKSLLMLKLLRADCLGLSLVISAQFTFEKSVLLKCVLQTKIAKNHQNPLF